MTRRGDRKQPDVPARIAEAARWHRCWHCYHAPCTCPPGEGLGQQVWSASESKPTKEQK